MKRLFISFAIVAVLAGTASAEKSVRTAYIASGVGTGVSSVLFLSAFFVGEKNGDVNMPLLYAGLGSGVITPSLGEFYVGKYLTVGMGIRVAAGLIATYGVVGHDQEVRDLPQPQPECVSAGRARRDHVRRRCGMGHPGAAGSRRRAQQAQRRLCPGADVLADQLG